MKQGLTLETFESLSDQAQLWVYAFSRPLGDEHETTVSQAVTEFIRGWNSHSTPVRGAFSIAFRRFVLIAGETQDGISGCSIDSSVSVMKRLRDDHQLDALDRSLVFLRDASGAVQALDRPSFRQAVIDGEVDAKTPVFDTTITRLGDLRAGRFETTFANSWHSRLFAGKTASPDSV